MKNTQDRPAESSQGYQLRNSIQDILDPEAFGATDPGLERARNEDQFMIGEVERSLNILSSSRPVDDGQKVFGTLQGHIFVVADGIGGHDDGESASGAAIDVIAQYSLMLMPWALFRLGKDSQTLANSFRNAVSLAQTSLRKVAAREGLDHRMGTTLTAAFVNWPDLYVVHVGDSRCYIVRDKLYRVTSDHTVAQQLVDGNAITQEQAERSHLSNVLVNAVGGSKDEFNVELRHAELAPNDLLLLCTDGLTKHVPDGEIEQILRSTEDGLSLKKCVQDLIQTAKRKGGSDNITVVAARWHTAEESKR